MKKNTILSMIGISFGILFIVLDHTLGSFPLNFIIKPIPIWCIAYYCLYHKKYLLTLGFVSGSMGDIFLTQQGETFFLMGLVSFLIGHILYSIYFLSNFKKNKQSYLFSTLVLLLSTGIAFFLIPKIEEQLQFPVVIYISGITLMVLSTLFYRNFNYFSFLGAIFFLVSDTLIAIHQFVMPIPLAHLWIMILYYIGQWGIGYGGCLEKH
ncbi:MAG: lysoplasmalogenase [Leptonema sp. (in: bacteria)]